MKRMNCTKEKRYEILIFIDKRHDTVKRRKLKYCNCGGF